MNRRNSCTSDSPFAAGYLVGIGRQHSLPATGEQTVHATLAAHNMWIQHVDIVSPFFRCRCIALLTRQTRRKRQLVQHAIQYFPWVTPLPPSLPTIPTWPSHRLAILSGSASWAGGYTGLVGPKTTMLVSLGFFTVENAATYNNIETVLIIFRNFSQRVH